MINMGTNQMEKITMKLEYPITLTLESDDVEFLLSYLDEEPQYTRANRIREEILLQTYE